MVRTRMRVYGSPMNWRDCRDGERGRRVGSGRGCRRCLGTLGTGVTGGRALDGGADAGGVGADAGGLGSIHLLVLLSTPAHHLSRGGVKGGRRTERRWMVCGLKASVAMTV